MLSKTDTCDSDILVIKLIPSKENTLEVIYQRYVSKSIWPVLCLVGCTVDMYSVSCCHIQVQQCSALFCVASTCTKVCDCSARWLSLYPPSTAFWCCADP